MMLDHPDERVALARLTSSPLSIIVTNEVEGQPVVDLSSYGRFKHGDGAVSHRYGHELGKLAADHLDPSRPVLASTSGYGHVPPAATSLLPGFVESLREAGFDVEPFRIHRASMTNGDYAKMSLTARKKALSGEALSVDADLVFGDAQVVALDDVRVTGVHEEAVDACLRASGAKDIEHMYVIDAWTARNEPEVESLLNQSGVLSTSALLALAAEDDFIPNARFCKRILTLNESSLREALYKLPAWVLEWMDDAITMDEYAKYPAYADGTTVFREVVWSA